jgi:hypothetical protein
MNRKILKFAAILLMTLQIGISNASFAAVILEVDISDPTSVVFTPTAEFAENTFLNVDTSLDGITLLGFFSGNATATDTALDFGSIDVFDSSAGVTRSMLYMIFIDNYAGGFTLDDVSFYDDSSASFITSFLDTKTALAELASHDLSLFTGMPAPGAIGSFIVGNPDNNRIIGQWQVTAAIPAPAPATLALFGLGLAGLGWSRRKKA